MRQEQIERRTQPRRDRGAGEAEVETRHDRSREHEDLSRDLDDLLDEIDSVLESNAEEFVKGYVQKGGE